MRITLLFLIFLYNDLGAQTLVPFFKKDGKYIYVDSSSMSPILNTEYESAGLFSNSGLARIQKNGLYGFINKQGKVIKECIYEDAKEFNDAMDGYTWVRLPNQKEGYIFVGNEESLPKSYGGSMDFSEGLTAVGNEKGIWGFIDMNDNPVINFKYESAENFSDGLAAVEIGGKYGYINKNGSIVIPIKYDNAMPFSDGLARVSLQEKWGYIDKLGHEVISLKFKDASDFQNGVASVTLNEKKGYINKFGEEVIPLKFDFASSFYKNIAVVGLNGKFGLITTKGKAITDIKYDAIWGKDHEWGAGSPLMIVNINEKFGCLDSSGKEIIPLKYDNLSDFNDGLAVVELNKKFVLINIEDKQLTEMKYDIILLYPESKDLIFAQLNGKSGYIDKSGKPVIPLKYDSVDPYFDQGFASVELNNLSFYIDKSGREYREK